MSEIERWCARTVEQMQDWERREMAVEVVPRDEAVACWIVRALADPTDELTNEVWEQIQQRREQMVRREQAKLDAWKAGAPV